MTYAEALNELGGVHQIPSWDGTQTYSISRDIKELEKGIHPIRIRGGIPDYPDDVYANKDELRKRLKRERQYDVSGYHGQLVSSIGEIRIQWRRPGKEIGWYNYHFRIRNCQELYTDTIYNATGITTGDKLFYPVLPSWAHSLNARPLPQDNLEFRVRLLYPLTYSPELDKSRATLWSTNHNEATNYNGYNFYDAGGDNGKGTYPVELTFSISANIETSWENKIDRIVISGLGKSNTTYSGSSVGLQASVTQN